MLYKFVLGFGFSGTCLTAADLERGSARYCRDSLRSVRKAESRRETVQLGDSILAEL